MRKIYIFDVDGTLTPSRRRMTKDFAKFFDKWSNENEFYLVSGSDLEKMKEQVPLAYLDRSLGLFTCGGNQFWVDGKLRYENKFKPPESLIDYLKEKLKNSKYPIRAGNHIENRGAMLNFSIVGRDCTLEQRKHYFEYDKKIKERQNIAEGIRFNWSKLDAVIGGQISIDIAPKGNDKSQVIYIIEQERLIKPDEYIFIGDRTMEGGNDYPLAKLLKDKDRPYGYAYQTEGWEHTIRLLKNTHNL